MDNVKEIIGRRINEALAMRDVKQKELAKALGVMDNTISYFAKGARTPNTEQIIKIANFLNVSTDFLLGLQKEPSTNKTIASLNKRLGLKKEAIEILEHFVWCEKENEYNKNLDAVNLMLSRNNIGLLNLIANYLYEDYELANKAANDGIKGVNSWAAVTSGMDIEEIPEKCVYLRSKITGKCEAFPVEYINKSKLPMINELLSQIKGGLANAKKK